MPADRPRSERERRFYAAWKLCASLGQCDASEGREFRRVFREWIACGQPARVMAFIRSRSNITAEGKP